MAKVTNIAPDASSDGQRQRSEVRFPGRGLADSLAVADEMHKQGGGKATADQLAAFLGYKGTDNGAYLTRVGAARLFGLIAKTGDFFTLTPLATQILMPTYPEQSKQGLVAAFLSVELFRRVYDEFKGKELPPEFGMKNALKNTFGVVPTRVDVAYRSLMDSADAAGFFATRGARTHLIMPAVQASPPVPNVGAGDEEKSVGGGSGGGNGAGGGGGGTLPFVPNVVHVGQPSLDAVKARYVQTLINVLEEKGKKGELDQELMTRIEKLLSVQ